MFAAKKNTFSKNEATTWPIPNYWDMVALVIVIAVVCLWGWGARSLSGQFQLGQQTPISLDPDHLPYYALLTEVRMLIAMFFSIAFTFVFATWAAKSRQAERIIIPAIDILQSVPVLGFLSIIVVALVALFQGSMLGPESAAIFAIFTAQAWNIALSFYQSLKMVPADLQEAADMFQLSAWQRFWRVEVPFAMPGLVWNIMMSMSASWIFLVASEAITVAHHTVYLPGIGSYIGLAVLQKNQMAILYVVITMMIVVGLNSQLIFRPLVAWSEKFKMDMDVGEEEQESWLLNLFHRARFMRHLFQHGSDFSNKLVNLRWFLRRQAHKPIMSNPKFRFLSSALINAVIFSLVIFSLVVLYEFIFTKLTYIEAGTVLYDGLLTAVRVVATVVISSLIWVPLGVWIGLNPRVSKVAQPIAQFLAAFPMNLIFPLVVWAVLYFSLNISVWSVLLMILSVQWYIVFNVIAGTTVLPKNLHYAVGTLGVSGWLWWRKLILPGIFPYYITGAIVAAGAAWNFSIIAEAVSWGHTHLWADGLGAYIVKASDAGDFQRLALGIVVMSAYVLAFNRFFWRPLYNIAERRFQIR